MPNTILIADECGDAGDRILTLTKFKGIEFLIRGLGFHIQHIHFLTLDMSGLELWSSLNRILLSVHSDVKAESV